MEDDNVSWFSTNWNSSSLMDRNNMNRNGSQKTIDDSKHLRYDNADQLRKNPPTRGVTQLDLSYCQGIQDIDLKYIRCRYSLELESVDLSGCQGNISSKELSKFLRHYSTITKLRLHDWKLDQEIIKLIISIHKITFLGISIVVKSQGVVSSGITFHNLFYLFGKQLEISNFEDYCHYLNSNAATTTLHHPRFSLAAQPSQINQSQAASAMNPMFNMTLLNSLITERIDVTSSSITEEFNDISIISCLCPHLEKLHLIFRKEMNARDLIVFLVRIMEISLMHTDEITFYLPSTIYTDAHKLQSLLVTLPDILPNITFHVMRHEEDQLKRKITKNSVNEKSRQYTDLLKHGTLATNSLSVDLLRGYEERMNINKFNMCDLSFELIDNTIVHAHRVIIESRCPLLLDATLPLNYSFASFELFMKFLYCDVLPVVNHKSDKLIQHSDLTVSEEILLEVRSLGKEFNLKRLIDICQLLIEGPYITDQFPNILQPDMSQDLYSACSLSSKIPRKFNDVTLIAHSQQQPDQLIKIQTSRFLLVTRCPYFEGFFNSGMKDTLSNCIEIPLVTSQSLLSFINYLNTNNYIFDCCSIFNTIEFSDRMSLPHLMSLCIDSMRVNLSCENVVFLAQKAYQCVVDDNQQIYNMCFDYFTMHALRIFSEFSKDLIELPWDMFKLFLAHMYNYLLEDCNETQNTVLLQCSILNTVLSWCYNNCINEHNEIQVTLLQSTIEMVFKYIHTNRISTVDFAYCLMKTEIFNKQLIISAFSGLGVVLEEEETKIGKKEIIDPSELTNNNDNNNITNDKKMCNKCEDWGYVREPVTCSKCNGLAKQLSFCSWCNSTGYSMKLGPPCNTCDKGEVVKLKSLFDQKVLNECIRINIPNYQRDLVGAEV